MWIPDPGDVVPDYLNAVRNKRHSTINKLQQCLLLPKSLLELASFYNVSAHRQNGEDMQSWCWTVHRGFTTSSAYAVLHNRGEINRTNVALWKLKLPNKIKVFLWVPMQNKLLKQQVLTTIEELCSPSWMSLMPRCRIGDN